MDMKKALTFLQDHDGDFSSKRLGMVLLILFLGIAILFHYQQQVINDLEDLIKWMGGFVASEQVSRFAPGSNTQQETSQPLGPEPYE